MPWLTSNGLELNYTIKDLRNLELEESLNETRVSAGDNNLWTLSGLTNLDDVSLESASMVIALVLYLLSLRQ